YIINASLNYTDENGLSVSAVFNRFGERIFSVGDVLFPTIYELPRNSLDLSVTKALGENYLLKLGVQDLLNAEYRFFEDSNRNFKVDSQDNSNIAFKRGQIINLSVTYNIF